MEEVWKDIQNYEGLYQVSNLGSVKSFYYGKEKILRPGKTHYGYLEVNLRMNNTSSMKKVHRLVCEAFLSNPENKTQVNHINGIKTDNRLDNLEWCTNSENQKHSFSILGRKSVNYGKFGSDNSKSKVIIRYTINNEYIDEFNGCYDAERKTGINKSNINQCCLYKRNSAGGFIWRYKKYDNL